MKPKCSFQILSETIASRTLKTNINQNFINISKNPVKFQLHTFITPFFSIVREKAKGRETEQFVSGSINRKRLKNKEWKEKFQKIKETEERET